MIQNSESQGPWVGIRSPHRTHLNNWYYLVWPIPYGEWLKPSIFIFRTVSDLQTSVYDSRDEIEKLVDEYERIMDQLDVFNRKVWNGLYPADVFGHGMDLINNGHAVVSQIRESVENEGRRKGGWQNSIRVFTETYSPYWGIIKKPKNKKLNSIIH